MDILTIDKHSALLLTNSERGVCTICVPETLYGANSAAQESK